ncbi:MAG: chemotaxis protein CheA [Vulcanimicrobiota bacterium]
MKKNNDTHEAKTDVLVSQLDMAVSMFNMNPGDILVLEELIEALEEIQNSRVITLDKNDELISNLLQVIEMLIISPKLVNDEYASFLAEACNSLADALKTGGKENFEELQVQLFASQTIIEKLREEETDMQAGEETTEFSPDEIDESSFTYFTNAVHQHITTIYESINRLKKGVVQNQYDNLLRSIQGIRGAAKFINHIEMALFAENLKNQLKNIKPSEKNSVVFFDLLESIKEFVKIIEKYIAENSPQSEVETAVSEKREFQQQALPEPGNNLNIKPVSAKKVSRGSKSIRIPVGKINVLMNSIEELLIINSALGELRKELEKAHTNSAQSKELNKIFMHFIKTTEVLYNKLISMRMAPVRSLFKKFEGVILELSREQKKDIDVRIFGEETEVDRLVLETLKDPLIHLVRNAVDHGVETPEERAGNGKSPQGVVMLRAFNDINSVVIEIEDNGKGIDWLKIREKVVSKGLLSQDEAQMMNEGEVLDFIFKPGFSTAEKITNISGRGVGMDVVKTAIEKMNGTINIDTTPGKGTCFIIRLPLAMTMIDAILIKAGNETYSIPADIVQKILKVNRKTFHEIYNRKVLPLKDTTLPYGYLTQVLDISEGPSPQDRNEIATLLIRCNDSLVALGVDEIIGKQKVVIKNLGGLLSSIKCISGASIHGDGNILLMLDGEEVGDVIKKLAS